jgi:phosphoribosyl-ATP pyrophosphohydrolase/phosphoribosyl-AMP cyclohydrolase/histidinol dehydrogenase
VRLGDLKDPQQQAWIDKTILKAAFDGLPKEQQLLLERVKQRIESFAKAQRNSIQEFESPVPGGIAAQKVVPVERAGCYAPGGRFPLPSSVLMTAVTAKVAGVEHVIVASPRPQEITKAAAYVAGADGLLAIGGAQAVGVFAYGCPGLGVEEPVDVIVGPGNAWVTAAKKLVVGKVAIDMLAGPSELLVLADDSADPEIIAADLLAQAEHDVVALPVLVTTSKELLEKVEVELKKQLEVLPTKETASACMHFGFVAIF